MLINIILEKDFHEQMYQGRSYVKDATGTFLQLQDLSGCILGTSNRGVESVYSSTVLLSIEDLGPSLSDHRVPLGGVLSYHSLRILGNFICNQNF